MYADPMPGQLLPGGLFASGPPSPMKLRLGKTKDWHDDDDVSVDESACIVALDFVPFTGECL